MSDRSTTRVFNSAKSTREAAGVFFPARRTREVELTPEQRDVVSSTNGLVIEGLDPDGGSGGQDGPQEPARNASKDEWVAWAEHFVDEVPDLTRDELVSMFGTDDSES